MSFAAPLRTASTDRPTRTTRSNHLRAVESVPIRDTVPQPPPALAVQRLALYAFEAVEGYRPIAQLGRLISADVIEELRQRRAARVERRTLIGDTRRIVPTPGVPVMGSPRAGVVEGVVVMRAIPRSTAVALRFEYFSGRWQATQVTVL